MSYEGFEGYSPEATELYVSLTSYRELYAARQEAVHPGRFVTDTGRAMAYQNIVWRAVRMYPGGGKCFTAEQLLEAALLTLRMDEAAARENKHNGGEYGL